MTKKQPAGKQPTKLDSWKEIGVFLGRDARTCQRWEKELGLPVHRFDGSPRSRVFAFRDEIEHWARTQSSALGLQSRSRRRTALFPLAAAAAAVLIVWIALVNSKRASYPADFKIYGDKLIILDENQRRIREVDTGFDTLEKDEYYRRGFRGKRFVDQSNYLPLLMIRDITGDRSPEILFAVQTTDHCADDLLICYDSDCRELWRRRFGRRTVYGGKVIENNYIIQGIDLVRFSKNDPPRILVIANHRSEFPSLTALVDAGGTIQGEYWNAGRINDHALLDIDRDGRRDLLLAGHNAEHNRPCLLVLDAEHIDGRSPAIDAAYACQEGFPGRPLAYLLLPCLSVNGILQKNTPIEIIETSAGKPHRSIRLANIIAYTLNYRLELTEVKLLQRFLMDLAKYRRTGRCSQSPEQIVDMLMHENADYYDGETFVSSPRMLASPEIPRD